MMAMFKYVLFLIGLVNLKIPCLYDASYLNKCLNHNQEVLTMNVSFAEELVHFLSHGIFLCT